MYSAYATSSPLPRFSVTPPELQARRIGRDDVAANMVGITGDLMRAKNPSLYTRDLLSAVG